MTKLINFHEREADMANNYEQAKKMNTGIGCPNCGCELFYVDKQRIIGEGNPKTKVICNDCQNSNYITV